MLMNPLAFIAAAAAVAICHWHRWRWHGAIADCNAMRDAIESLTDGVIAAGANGRVCAANAAGRSALGVPADLALIGARLRDVLAWATPAMPGALWQDAQSSPCADKPEALREVLSQGNDGRTWRVRMQGLNSGGVAAVFHDITMQTHQRVALAAASETVAAATQARTEFLAGISHDLRTPAHAVLAAAGMVACGTADEVRAAGSILRDQAHVLLDRVEALIALAETAASNFSSPDILSVSIARPVITQDEGGVSGTAAKAHQHLRILLADDNATNRLVARAMLRRLGHEVTEAGDGVEALLQLNRAQFDLVLLDLMMPQLDGTQTTRAMRAMDTPIAGLPVIGITASTVAADRDAALAAGMTAVLTKPVTAAALASAIVSCLG